MLRRDLLALACAAVAFSASPGCVFAQTAWASPGKTSKFSVKYGNGGELLFIGTAHTNDPADPQIAEIRGMLQAFKPEILFVEGGRWPTVAPPEAAVKPFGELAFASNIGRELRSQIEDADPPLDTEIASVLKLHGPERTKLFYALRMVPQFVRSDASQASAQMDRWLRSRSMRPIESAAMPMNTTAELQNACDDLLPELGLWSNASDEKWWRGSSGNRTWLLDVQDSSSIFRDRFLLDRVATEILQGRRIVVVAGLAHLDALMQSLRQEIKRRTADGS